MCHTSPSRLKLREVLARRKTPGTNRSLALDVAHNRGENLTSKSVPGVDGVPHVLHFIEL